LAASFTVVHWLPISDGFYYLFILWQMFLGLWVANYKSFLSFYLMNWTVSWTSAATQPNTVPKRLRNRYTFYKKSISAIFHYYITHSVVDPLHFGTDPISRIRTTDLRIQILLFPSVADKMPKKICVFFKVFVLISVWTLKVHLLQFS
jgi:hypothetical protein